MNDYRINSLKATELMSSGKSMVFRLRLKNGNIVERTISPVGKPTKIYSNNRVIYKAKPGYEIEDITKINKLQMNKVGSEPLQSLAPSTVHNTICTLLDSGYISIE